MIVSNFQMQFDSRRVQPKAPANIDEIESAVYAKEVADEVNRALEEVYFQANTLRKIDATSYLPGTSGDLDPAAGRVAVAETARHFGSAVPGKAVLQYDDKSSNIIESLQSYEYRTPDGLSTKYEKNEKGEITFTTHGIEARMSPNSAFITYLS